MREIPHHKKDILQKGSFGLFNNELVKIIEVDGDDLTIRTDTGDIEFVTRNKIVPATEGDITTYITKKDRVDECIDKYNFYDATRATFTRCESPHNSPDFISESGSKYWIIDTGIMRESDHWSGAFGISNIRTCYWYIDIDPRETTTQTIAGFCAFENFDLIPRKESKLKIRNQRKK